MGKRYVAHAGSLYSGVSGTASHTKPLDEDVKQGFHSLLSFSDRLDGSRQGVAVSASLNLLVNRIRAPQVSSEGNAVSAQPLQTVQYVQ